MPDKPTQNIPDDQKFSDTKNEKKQLAGCASPVIESGLDMAKKIIPCNKIPVNSEKDTMVG